MSSEMCIAFRNRLPQNRISLMRFKLQSPKTGKIKSRTAGTVFMAKVIFSVQYISNSPVACIVSFMIEKRKEKETREKKQANYLY